jgi:cytochrome c biogenesis protein CcdA
MDLKLGTYLIYLAVSIVLTIWVARTLLKNGQVFLDDAFADERLAKSVNHLLVVGFYLLNLGYVAVALKISQALPDGSSAMEALAWKLGLVLLVLGGVHFFNLFVLSRFRRRRLLDQLPPPVPPSRMIPAGYPQYPMPPMPPMPPRPAAPHGYPRPAPQPPAQAEREERDDEPRPPL